MLETIRTALVIAPHPDDEVLGCGGTIARLSGLGCDVHVGIVTRADGPDFAPDVVEIGRREAHAAHHLLGVKQTHYLDLPAAALDRVAHSEMNKAIGKLVADVEPDTVFVPFLGDVHLDHQLVFLSSLVAVRPRNAKTPLRVYAYETLSETNWYAPGITPTFAPNVYVDISGFLDRKIEAFSCFASQIKAFPDERSKPAIHALATLRGATVYKQAAEAFMLIRQIA
jgi:N-acetylglucosamine malate deacetylase 1